MNWAALITAILESAPALIKSIEDLLGAGGGNDKKQAAVGNMTEMAVAAGANSDQVQAVSKMAGEVVDAGVAAFNASGVFKKS